MALLFTVLLSASGLMLGYFLYQFGQQSLVRETGAAIDIEIENILALTSGDTRSQRIRHIAGKAAQGDHPVYAYHTAPGKVLAGNINNLPRNVERLSEGLISFELEGSRRMAAKVHTFADGDRLLVARDIGHITQAYERLRWYSLLIIAFMLIVIVSSFLISTYVVGRINSIAMTAQRIMKTGDLSQRLDIDSDWDDLSYLAETLNALLSRVESLMHGIREVSNDIAHDLRTPLTRLRNRLESLHKEHPEASGFSELLEECDHLLGTFNALLRIASMEHGARTQAFTDLQPGRILRDVIELYEPVAEARQLRIRDRIVAMRPLSGDRQLLFQLFANLLDNAIKFSPPGSEVSIELNESADRACFSVADHGPGLSDGEKTKVFDRFYRADKSRHTEGSGLGLSLVKAIVDLHSGRIELRDNHPGLRVCVYLPH